MNILILVRNVMVKEVKNCINYISGYLLEGCNCVGLTKYYLKIPIDNDSSESIEFNFDFFFFNKFSFMIYIKLKLILKMGLFI